MDLYTRYKRSLRPDFYGVTWLFWVIFLGGPLALFGGAAVFCAIKSSAPWWVLIIGMAWGNMLGLWTILSGYALLFPVSNRIISSLRFFGFYLSFKIIADLLAWHVIPQERHHFLFDMGILLSILFGWMLVVLPAVIRQSRFNG